MRIQTNLVIITIMVFFTITSSLNAELPKPILVELYDIDGSYPDNIRYPEEGTIEYKVWFVNRANDVLHGPTFFSTARMDQGKFVLIFNLGNFNSLWEEDEILHLEVLQHTTGYVADIEFPVEAGSSPQALFDDQAIILSPPSEPERKQQETQNCHDED